MRKHQLIAIVSFLSGLFMQAQTVSLHDVAGIRPNSSVARLHPYSPGELTAVRYDLAPARSNDTTRKLVSLVSNAVALVRTKGEAAFKEFRVPGSRWRKDDSYIFVLDTRGNMLVNADPSLEGKNQIDLKDINGKPIVRGILAATVRPSRPAGWYHYEWPVPGGLQPRWKSSYAQRVVAPSGKSYIVGCGMYTDQMEREFVVDAVEDAIAEIQKNQPEAFRLFHDRTGRFIAKDAYIMVIDSNGVELVNPALPNLEGRNVTNVKDTRGKFLVQEMLRTVKTSGSGWVDYMWPKPGESISTQKSTYVSKAKLGNNWLVVGCGVYLADAPTAASPTKKLTAPELMTLVREAAARLEASGESAFPEFRQKGFRWLMDDTYFFVFSMDGTRTFHAVEPTTEGRNDMGLKDIAGRPFIRMFLDAGATPEGEGWVHYLWPEPGSVFPAWKSSFVKRVTFPSGKQYIVGSGIYNMQMDKAFIEDVVNRAATLVAEQGKDAFPLLRDKTGPFVFMNTYVFVDNTQGVELVNAAQPSMEGKNLINAKDLNGKYLVRDYIDAAMKNGSAWVDYLWYKPGTNDPVQKHSYVKKVQHGKETYIIGAGLYNSEEAHKTGTGKLSWIAPDGKPVVPPGAPLPLVP